MERREDLHRHGCSIAKQTILTTHPSGLQTRVSVELANFDALCVHSECSTKPKRPMWEGSPFLTRRGILGGVSAHGTPVLGRRSDAVNEGRLSQQCTPVMRRREVESPGGSPLPARRCEEESETEVDNSVISGWLKFRDNKRMSTTTENTFKYYIIHLIKGLPNPSFPHVICVPKSWIKVTFPDGKVAVYLPDEDYSITANRIRAEDPGDDWRLCWARVLERKNNFDTAINNAVVLNEALLLEAQIPQETGVSSNNIHHQSENQSQNIETGETFKEIRKQNETAPTQTTQKNQQQNNPVSEMAQDKEVSEENLGENVQPDAAEDEENQPQDQDNSEKNQCENEDDSEENEQSPETSDVLSEKSMSGSEQGIVEDDENQSQSQDNSEENRCVNEDDSDTEDPDWELSLYKEQRKRKRVAKEINNTANVKKRHLTNMSHSENVIPSTSQSNLSSLKNTRKYTARRKFMEMLDLKYKDLEKHFFRLDEVLEALRKILNKITKLFVEAIYNVTLMIEGDDMDDDAGQNLGHQRSENQIKSNDDKEQRTKQKSYDKESNNTPSEDNIGQYSKSSSTQPYADKIDESSKWTLRYEAFKPQPGLTELFPGCGIYISETELQICEEIPENSPTKVARHLLCEIFSDEALRKCTLLGGNHSKPGLDKYARRQLYKYVKEFCSDMRWKFNKKSIDNSLRKKLWECSQ